MAKELKASITPYIKINLLKKCLTAKASISLLMDSLRLIERGFIKTDAQLEQYLFNRIKRTPKYTKDAEVIKAIIQSSLF